MSDAVAKLPIGHLQTNPFQPREKIKKEDLEDLAKSIKNFGILEPIIAAHTPAGYQIIAGERRWRAAQLAGLTEVPVIIKETSRKGMLEMAIVENVQRINLSPIERAQAFQRLARDFHYSNAEIAEKVGKSGPYVSNSLRLLHLPDAIKDGLASRSISEGHARALLGIASESDMVDCYKIILKENASVRRAEELARHYRKAGKRPQIQRNSSHLADTEELETWKEQVLHKLPDKVQIRFMRSKTQTRVIFTFKGDVQKTQAALEKFMRLTTDT